MLHGSRKFNPLRILAPVLSLIWLLPKLWYTGKVFECEGSKERHAFSLIKPIPPLPRRRYALLIDADNIGPAYWKPAMKAVQKMGHLVHSFVFAAPGLLANRDVATIKDKANAQHIVVPRSTGGGKDPNDIAIAMEATRLVLQGGVDSIALLASDSDFVYVAERLKTWGYRCVIIRPEGVHEGLTRVLVEANIECVRIGRVDGSTPKRPTMKAVLDATGQSHFQRIVNPKADFDATGYVKQRLLQLGFVGGPDDFLLPAIAKFFYAQGIGGLAVWPAQYAYEDCRALLASSADRVWRPDPGNLIFVLPQSVAGCSKGGLKTFGSEQCARMVRGGGPFVMRADKRAADQVLRRLGYLEDDLNSNFSEAIDVFAERVLNLRNLKSIGLSIDPQCGESTKRELLHSALVSEKLTGYWNTAPLDNCVREWMVSRNMISCVNVSRKHVLIICQEFIRRHGLEPACTYNKAVQVLDRHRTGKHPQSRRG